jgi:hypothetical protein
MSDGMRIALIGVVASLMGTLIGGGITYAVTQSQISSQEAESHRTERLDAYSTYFGESEKFLVDVQTITGEGLRPRAVTSAQRTDVNTFGETLIGDYARVVLLAPVHVVQLADQLQRENVEVWNDLVGGKIDYRHYDPAVSKLSVLIRQFTHATRKDIGAS